MSADHFDVLVVQGNLAVSAPQGLATWPIDKPVWIDPITYAFAASPAYLRSDKKERTYKKTFQRLASDFGQPYQLALEEHRAVVPGDFASSGAVGNVERVLVWQEQIFSPPEEDQKYGAEPISPALLTIPFFPLMVREAADTTPPAWLETNLTLISEAAELRPTDRLAAGFLAELDVFDHPNFDAWLGTYADHLTEAGIRHLWWWISDHDEVTTSLQRATKLVRSFRLLADRGISVHQAFGGSLSTLSLTKGLATVAHGVNYWEQKGWEPISSGGLPSARYFHPKTRERLRVPEAIVIVDQLIEDSAEFYEQVCQCQICRKVVGDDLTNFGAFGEVNIKTRRTRGGGTAEFDSPTSEALFLTKSHHLHAKGLEVAQALSKGFDPSTTLQTDAESWASDLTRTRHLDRWALALNL